MIKLFLCLFIVFSVSANALSAVYDIHSEEVSSHQNLDLSHEDHHSSSASHSDADHCISHCGMWHILNLRVNDSVVLNPSVKVQSQQWYFLSVSEKNHSNKLWRPPTFLS